MTKTIEDRDYKANKRAVKAIRKTEKYTAAFKVMLAEANAELDAFVAEDTQ